LALVLDGEGNLLALDVDKGEERFRWEPAKHAAEVKAWLDQQGAAPHRDGAAKAGGGAPGGSPRILDARRLHSGMLLVLGQSERKWIGVIDPANGKLMEGEVLSRLRQGGDEALAAHWAAHNEDLGQVWELPDEAGSSLLLRGADGWYEVRLR
jgi:hypothetical protein